MKAGEPQGLLQSPSGSSLLPAELFSVTGIWQQVEQPGVLSWCRSEAGHEGDTSGGHSLVTD